MKKLTNTRQNLYVKLYNCPLPTKISSNSSQIIDQYQIKFGCKTEKLIISIKKICKFRVKYQPYFEMEKVNTSE